MDRLWWGLLLGGLVSWGAVAMRRRRNEPTAQARRFLRRMVT